MASADHSYFTVSKCDNIKTFSCYDCNKNFKARFRLNEHMKRVHNIRNGSAQCLEENCGKAYSHKKDLEAHLEIDHGFQIEIQQRKFSSLNDFNEWKQDLEKETNSKFVKKGVNNSSNNQYYQCHRSGIYISKGSNKRQLKSQGSLKCGNTCIASITLHCESHDDLNVRACLTHYGHKENESRHLKSFQTKSIIKNFPLISRPGLSATKVDLLRKCEALMTMINSADDDEESLLVVRQKLVESTNLLQVSQNKKIVDVGATSSREPANKKVKLQRFQSTEKKILPRNY